MAEHERVEADSRVEADHEGAHEPRNRQGVGSLVDDLVAAFVADVDRPLAIPARRLRLVVTQHHVVHGADPGRIKGCIVLVAHGQDVAQCLPITLNFEEGPPRPRRAAPDDLHHHLVIEAA
jgi:hypothetical protein